MKRQEIQAWNPVIVLEVLQYYVSPTNSVLVTKANGN